MEEKKKPPLLVKICTVLGLITSLAVAISITVWSKRPDYCLVDVIDSSFTNSRIISIAQENDLRLKTDLQDKVLNIRLKDIPKAAQLFGDGAIQISDKSSLVCRFYQGVLQRPFEENDDLFLKNPKYAPIIKLVIGSIIIVTFILVAVRPLLRFLIYPEGGEEANESEADVVIHIGEEFQTPVWFAFLGTLFWSAMYIMALFITMLPMVLERYDIGIVAFSVVLPSLSFYQIINGLMSVEYYWSKLTFTDDGFIVETKNAKKRVLWSRIERVKEVNMSSVFHIYDKDGERVYSASTDLENTTRLYEYLKKKAKY